MRGVETQKLKERRRGKTVSRGFKSSMVTISFFPRLACLLTRENIIVNSACVIRENKIVKVRRFAKIAGMIGSFGLAIGNLCRFYTRAMTSQIVNVAVRYG